MKNKLKIGLKKNGGRNIYGRLTNFAQGGGVKIKYRFIDFKRNTSLCGYVKRIEKDPNRSAFIALICYDNGTLSYILATESLKLGTKIESFINVDSNFIGLASFKAGNTFRLNNISNGTLINNLELYPNNGGIFARAAGTFLQVLKKYNEEYVLIKLRSGEQRLVSKRCVLTLGIVSNIYNSQNKLVKAGQSRRLGVRPSVRGIAMNPVDHPHGGRTNGGTPPQTPWGVYTKGTPTRDKKKSSRYIILSRRKLKLNNK